MTPTQEQLDKAADALRLFEMKDRVSLPWDKIATAQKRKWREKAGVVLASVDIINIHLQPNHTVKRVGECMVVTP